MDASSPINGIAPFFIVEDLRRSLTFYRDQLGFDLWYAEPADDPFFAMLGRGGAMLMLKSVGVSAQPNSVRHRDARWDAYLNSPDPDSLYAELRGRGVEATVELQDTSEGLRGFELTDPDGHVLFFGRPNDPR